MLFLKHGPLLQSFGLVTLHLKTRKRERDLRVNLVQADKSGLAKLPDESPNFTV